jgi:hypothetical protein
MGVRHLLHLFTHGDEKEIHVVEIVPGEKTDLAIAPVHAVLETVGEPSAPAAPPALDVPLPIPAESDPAPEPLPEPLPPDELGHV